MGKSRTGRPDWGCFKAALVDNSLIKSARTFAKSAFCDVTKLRLQVAEAIHKLALSHPCIKHTARIRHELSTKFSQC